MALQDEFPLGEMEAVVMAFDHLSLEELDTVEVEELSPEELQAYLQHVQDLYDDLQADEPDEIEEPEAFAEWLDELEDLDSLMDDIQDLLED